MITSAVNGAVSPLIEIRRAPEADKSNRNGDETGTSMQRSTPRPSAMPRTSTLPGGFAKPNRPSSSVVARHSQVTLWCSQECRAPLNTSTAAPDNGTPSSSSSPTSVSSVLRVRATLRTPSGGHTSSLWADLERLVRAAEETGRVPVVD